VVPAIGPQATYLIGGITAGLAVFVLLRTRRYLREDEAGSAATGTAELASEEPVLEQVS
jgi:hypothetical protein